MNEIINTNDLLNSAGITKQQLYRYCLSKVLISGEDYKLINGRNYVYFYSALSKLIEYRKRTKAKQSKAKQKIKPIKKMKNEIISFEEIQAYVRMYNEYLINNRKNDSEMKVIKSLTIKINNIYDNNKGKAKS